MNMSEGMYNFLSNIQIASMVLSVVCFALVIIALCFAVVTMFFAIKALKLYIAKNADAETKAASIPQQCQPDTKETEQVTEVEAEIVE